MQTLILKSLNSCNLRCDYCSVGNKEHTQFLSEEQMSAALRFFTDYIQAKGENHATVIFHGGEPMLLPAAQYDRCIKEIRRRVPEVSFRFSMQTNGTLLSPEYLTLFQEHDIHIGVSLDGSRAIHDGQRRDTAGLGTYDQVLEHIRTLQDNHVPVAALMVLTRPALTDGLQFLDCFDQLDLPLKINPLLSLGNAKAHPELALQPGEYGRYLAQVFAYAAERGLNLSISPLDEIIHNILHEGGGRGCQYSPTCHSGFLCVDPEGIVYPCGRFADTHENAIGNIQEGIMPHGEEILAVLSSRRTTNLPARCRSCKYVQLCHAGCSADQSWELAAESPCTVCEDYRYIFHYLKTKGMQYLRKQLLEERMALLQRISEIGAMPNGI